MASPGRTQRRRAERATRNKSIPDATVKEAIDRAKRGERQPKDEGAPDGATMIAPTPEQIAAMQEAQVAANAGAGDAPPLDPSQMPPELLKQLEDMGGNPGAMPGGAGGLVAPKSNARRAKKYIDLEKELAVVLTLPAAPCEMSGDSYCAMHFAMQGPQLAHRLTVYAETHDATFELLCRIVEAGGIFTLIIAVAGYLLPPLLHHGMPAPQGLRDMYHVPPKAPPVGSTDGPDAAPAT